MKALLIILFTFTFLIAKANETCYTVQLMSKFNTQKNVDKLNLIEFSQECKVMQIGKTTTVRCGCYDTIAPAKSKLLEYKKKYKKAALATTYKYRFENSNSKRSDSLVEKTILASMKTTYKKDSPTETKKAKSVKKKGLKVESRTSKVYQELPLSQEDEELRLMLQVFLYKGDLKSAYKVATIGYKKNSNSYYWNQKMGEISKWTNRSARAMKHLRFLWEIDKNPEIEEELIKYGSEFYQYEAIEPLVVNRAQRTPTEENIDLMILVYKKIGYPEKVVAVLESQYLEDPSRTILLTKALGLSLEIGDLELSERFIKLIEANKLYSKADAVLLARYYYINQDVPKAYERLFEVDENLSAKEPDEIKYFELLSDLGWYLQHNDEAARASKELFKLKKARLVDYERISLVYQKSDPKLAQEAVKSAYKEYKLSYLFYSYATSAMNAKNYDELKSVLDDLDESSPLQKEALYWVVKSQVYAYYKQKELEKEALLTAFALAPENYQIQLTLLWYFMDVNDVKSLNKILTDMAESSDLDSFFYFPLASAYFSLSDVNKASYFTQKLLYANDRVTQSLQFKFLQAYIYQAQNNEEAFQSSMIDIVSQLKAEAKENPRLKVQDAYLSNYLRASMHVSGAEKFEKDLKKAKKYLTKQNYNDISYSWASKNNAQEKSLKIFYKIEKKELWLQFSNAMNFQEHSKIENLLDLYLEELSIGDAVQALEKDGQISASQTIAFDALLKNDDNQNAYIQHLDLSKKRSDFLDIKISNNNRNPLLQKDIQINNKTYLQNSLYLDSSFNYYINSTLDTKYLVSVPNSIKEISASLSKFYDRGSVGVNLEFHDAMERYLALSIFSRYQFSTDLTGGVTLAKNTNALEGTQLLLGGKKDMLALILDWQLLNSTFINVLYEKNSYNSQNNFYLGRGDYARITLTHQIRNGYPDLTIGGFYDFGKYGETAGSRGSIDKLQLEISPVLPVDFTNMGLNISYGMANRGAYTRVWRPYFELFPYYSKEIDKYTYGFNVGYGGKAWHQDHLSVGASYTDTVSGTGSSIFELYVNYQFMYSHP